MIIAMKTRLQHALLRALNRMFNPMYKIREKRLGNVSLQVYQGTFTKIDKDDAWYAWIVRDARVVFDIGANVGKTALLANIYGKPQHIVLVDPNPMALTYAAGNLILNDYSSRCTFVKQFVSDKSREQVKFYTIGTGAAGSMFASHAKTASRLGSWFWVSTTTLDELCASLNLNPDLVKIDVEGAEHRVLLGATQVASEQNLRFFIELHSNADLSMEKNCSLVLKWAHDMGYKVWYLTDGNEITSPEQIKHRGRCHVLLLKNDLSYPSELNRIKQGDKLPEL